MPTDPKIVHSLGTALGVLHNKFFYSFLSIIVLYGIGVAALTNHFGAFFSAATYIYSPAMHLSLSIYAYGFIIWRVSYLVLVQKPDRLMPALVVEARTYLLNPRRIISAVPILLLLTIFFSSFTSAKNLIPIMNPFYLDPALADFEKWLHFGKQPWEWLQPVVGVALVTSAISFTYKTWFIAKFSTCFWLAFSLERPQLRAQFFISFVLCWIFIGTIMATLLSSAGPVYFGGIYPDLPNPFASLVQYLREADHLYPVFDLTAIDYLWDSYVERKTRLFSGISAMPSMHVSLACLFALLGRRVNRTLGVLLFVYFVLILIGSVHLGWHYAVDGYAAVIMTCSIWWLSGKAFPETQVDLEMEA